MKSMLVHTIVVAAFILAAPAFAAPQSPGQPVPPGGQAGIRPRQPATLTVRGQGEVEVPADQVRISLGVVSQAPKAPEAVDQNSRAMQAVIAALQEAGLGADEYETGRYSISPVYDWNRPREQGQQDGPPQVVAYNVQNTITITSKQLDKVGPWIAAAVEAGANSVDSISFEIAEPRAHRAKAITQAVERARADATTLAAAAGVRTRRVLSITLDDAVHQPVMFDAMMSRAGAAEVAAPPVKPGEITLRASVTIVYEITSAEAPPEETD